jgi:hypothetical protein
MCWDWQEFSASAFFVSDEHFCIGLACISLYTRLLLEDVVDYLGAIYVRFVLGMELIIH